MLTRPDLYDIHTRARRFAIIGWICVMVAVLAVIGMMGGR
jgi:hypothetical protein